MISNADELLELKHGLLDFKHGLLDFKNRLLDFKNKFFDFKNKLLVFKHGLLDIKHYTYTYSDTKSSTCVAKLAPDEKPPTVMEFASMDGTLGKELPDGGGGVGVRHP